MPYYFSRQCPKGGECLMTTEDIFKTMQDLIAEQFAIDADEGMSSHAASGDALITVLEGTGEITVNDVPHQLSAGQSIVMTSGSPHSVRGVTPFKMQLTVVKPAE